jgi:hypothetical protein
MIAEHNRMSLFYGVPGVILQFPGPFLVEYLWPQANWLPKLVAIVGSVLLLVGLSYYARAKGRNPAWCLLAFLSWLGILLLALLEDRSGTISKVPV